MGGPVALTAEQANKLLDMLSEDDAYRALFEKNYQKAMANLGVTNPPPCNTVTKLASKERISKSRDALHSQLIAARQTQGPVRLECDE